MTLRVSSLDYNQHRAVVYFNDGNRLVFETKGRDHRTVKVELQNPEGISLGHFTPSGRFTAMAAGYSWSRFAGYWTMAVTAARERSSQDHSAAQVWERIKPSEDLLGRPRGG